MTTSMTSVVIAAPFPIPPNGVRRAFDILNQPPRRDKNQRKPHPAAARPDDLVRPWDPGSCPDQIRAAVWAWCEQVAEWINHEYCWRPDTMIPACWPAHPHIARELAVLAVLRWNAEQARDPAPIEVWHRDTYPGFCHRMTQRLGESTCRAGRHIDWPAAPRHAAYLDSTHDRIDTITSDSANTKDR